MKSSVNKDHLLYGLGGILLIVVLFFSYKQTEIKKNYNPLSQKMSVPSGMPTFEELSKNKLTVLYFGFLSCPDVCPTTLSEVTKIFKTFSPEKLNNMVFLFVDLDPERDSLEKMINYTSHFHSKITPAIVELKSLNLFTNSFGIVFMKVPLKSAMGYTIDHSTQMVMLSPDQKETQIILHDDSKDKKTATINSFYQKYFKQ